jgi:hypothetical protein
MFPPASPDAETFSTPPTTPSVVPVAPRIPRTPRTHPPTAALAATAPTSTSDNPINVNVNDSQHQHQRQNNHQLQRRGSARPQNLLIDPAKGAIQGLIGTDIVLQRTPDGEATVLIPIAHSNSVPDIQEQSVSHPLTRQSNMYGALNSPCFVHSHLERGASLKDWLTQQHNANANVGVSKSISPHALPPTVSEDDPDLDVELDHANSLTRQLAETAIGVREMNKALSQSRFYPPSSYTYTSMLIILPRSCTRPLQPL